MEDAVAKVTARSIIDYIELKKGLRRKNVEKQYNLYILEVSIEWKSFIEQEAVAKQQKKSQRPSQRFEKCQTICKLKNS